MLEEELVEIVKGQKQEPVKSSALPDHEYLSSVLEKLEDEVASTRVRLFRFTNIRKKSAT